MAHPQTKAKDVTLKLDIDSRVKDIEVMTDRPKLKQIVWNLTNNAVKFTQKGEVVMGCTLEGNQLSIYISDTGIGIAPEMHEKVFDRFVQAYPSIQLSYGGTGLGLSIAKGYVLLLGGDIKLQSEPNIGTKVFVSIPIENPAKPKQ